MTSNRTYVVCTLRSWYDEFQDEKEEAKKEEDGKNFKAYNKNVN